MHDNALSRLQRDEICIVELKDGTRREATWSPHNHGFYLRPPGEVKLVPHEDIAEWWPAGVKF